MTETRPLKRLKRFVRYLLLRAVLGAIGLLPVSVARGLGTAVGRLGWRLAGGERRKSLKSLEIAFPELSVAEREAIGRDAFAHLGACAGELCGLARIDPIIERYVELPAPDRALLEQALAEKKGVVFVSGHVGNFELLARRFSMGGYPCQTIAKEASDPRSSALVARIRASGRLKTIWRGRDGAAKEMIRALKGGEILGLLIDQDTRVQGHFVDFFGRQAFTPRAAADLALRTGAAVVCGFIARQPDGTHRIALQRLEAPATGSRESDSRELTRQLSHAIEQAIRAQPHAWVWMHQRWKTRPPPDAPAAPDERAGVSPG